MAEQLRGTCSVCLRVAAIRRDGCIRTHFIPRELLLAGRTDRQPRPVCEGSGRPQPTAPSRRPHSERREPDPPVTSAEKRSLDLSRLVTLVNGFVYSGDRTNAVVDTVRVLSDHPDLAVALVLPEVAALVEAYDALHAEFCPRDEFCSEHQSAEGLLAAVRQRNSLRSQVSKVSGIAEDEIRYLGDV